MGKLRKYCFRSLPLFLFFLLFHTGCREVEVFPKEDKKKEVYLLLSLSGLGDLSYNDNILRSILLCREQFDFNLWYEVPTDKAESEVLLQTMLDRCRENKESLFILASSEYASISQGFFQENEEVNDRILLFESPSGSQPVHSFNFCAYGVSFLSGILARQYTQHDKAAYVGGRKGEAFLEEALQGFTDGFLFAGGKEVITWYLSDTSDGFAMADKAYSLCESILAEAPFIYSVAGGSNMGVYRYMRETGNGLSIGMNVDQSSLATGIIASMVKKMDLCLYDHIDEWIHTGTLPAGSVYDLSGDYIDLLPSESQKPELQPLLDMYKPIAIEKEKEYLKNLR